MSPQTPLIRKTGLGRRTKLGRGFLGLAGFLLLLYGGASLASRPIAANVFTSAAEPLVIAHQGGEKIWPSNTMYAFERAVDLGVDVLEMDAHATADGVLVLMHDDTVDRTTDGSGAIKDLTLADIQTLDAGHYWSDDDGATYPFRDQGITVPTLESLFVRYPDFPMNIEIKPDDAAVAHTLCELIRAHDKSDHVLIASFHPAPMDAFRAACPEVATSGVEGEIRIFFGLNTLLLGATYQPATAAFQVPEYSGDIHVVTGRFIRGAHRHNIAVHVWTVNETTDMQRFVDLGVDGIITDRPDRLLALLGR